MRSRACIGLLGVLLPVLAAAEVGFERKGELLHLLRHDCGSCHGMQLGGGLGPALTPDSLADRSSAALTATILYGRPGTPMPPWSGFVSREEAQWLVDIMKRGDTDVGESR